MSEKTWHLEVRISAKTRSAAIVFLKNELRGLEEFGGNAFSTRTGFTGLAGGYVVLRDDAEFGYPLDDRISLFSRHLDKTYFNPTYEEREP